MRKILRSCLYFIIATTIYNCKTDQKDKTKTDQQYNFQTENLNCLKKNDSLAVEMFKKKFAQAILKKDKTAMMSYINSPRLLNDYYEGITEYCIRSTIADYNEVSYEEFFSKKEGVENCFVFGISNSFPELEFNYIFIFEKINGEIKLTKVELIG